MEYVIIRFLDLSHPNTTASIAGIKSILTSSETLGTSIALSHCSQQVLA
jgi:hypothetical protein